MGDNEIGNDKNEGKSLVISIAMAILSKLTSTEKGQKLTYSSYIERFKVNFNVKRFKVTHAAL